MPAPQQGSPIVLAAQAARDADHTTRGNAAKQTVLEFLDGHLTPNALSVAEVTDDGATVLTDGTVFLAVQPDGVHYVTGEPGDWTDPLMRPLTDAVDLAEQIAD